MRFIKLLLLQLVLTSSCVLAGSDEQQRKYDFDDYNAEVVELLTEGSYVSGLNVDVHSTYQYMDIYFDTKNQDLYNNGLSFRVRKRVYEDGDISWGVQLKSEMTESGETRMEVEIDSEEVEDYRVKFRGDDVALTYVLNEVFVAVSHKLEGGDKLGIDDQLSEIESWAEDELDDAKRAPGRSPFETLLNLSNGEEFVFKSLKGFAPIIAGRSERIRSHIYVDLTDTTDELINLAPSEKSAKKTPEYLQQEHLIWTMEASYDNSQFIPLRKGETGDDGWCDDCGRRANIREYEVENKYSPSDSGTFILDIYENAIVDMGAYSTLDSKYHQAASAIYKRTQ
ncbi:hypothetical protein [Shewanella atlantica]|uniref:hypothetical protein n=1 Tax=Shewanella atlantica TaxID=271099 RepID=UPI0037362A8D